MSGFAVFGNPIKHSKSAEIYALFAREIGILEEYDLKLVLENENFYKTLVNFFSLEGLGANVTVPFKECAFKLCDQFTERAKIARSVNVIKKQCDGSLLGDNTDGIGLVSDLKRLRWIINNRICVIHKNYPLADVLLIGAGGATKGIIPELLSIPNCNLNVVNRTYSRAQSLVKSYYKMGEYNISCEPLDTFFFNNNKEYDLVINATSSSMYDKTLKIPLSIIGPSTKCYDLFYQKENTSFLRWCQKNGSRYCADGLGMLVEQAAYSFFLWHNSFPTNTVYVLSYLRSIL